MVTIYCLTTISPEEIEEADMLDFNSDFRHSSEIRYLEDPMPSWADVGETVYLYKMTAEFVESIIVLLLDEEFYWNDYVDYFDFELVKSMVMTA